MTEAGGPSWPQEGEVIDLEYPDGHRESFRVIDSTENWVQIETSSGPSEFDAAAFRVLAQRAKHSS